MEQSKDAIKDLEKPRDVSLLAYKTALRFLG